MKTLSIVIPAYNEERFIGTLLERIRAVDLAPQGFTRELIVVDDCSKDRTAEIVAQDADVHLIRQPKNAGKGAAVRAGLAAATGEVVIIQDADLEYDPHDHVKMLDVVISGRSPVVYGSRYLGRGRHENQTLAAYLGGRSLSLVAWAFTGIYLTDTVTALKMFPRELAQSLNLETSGFELDHEITAKVAARGQQIVEVPISYFPRSKAEGKKIGLKDWFIAVRTFWRYRRAG
jgi:glycosyltransferase involved in cell wall biosynthesis